MRWQDQEIHEEAERRLPGLAHPERIRTFDAPEAMGVRFHEVEARSAINSVGGNSLPFNHTVNPYRGCGHACTYCLEGSTELLLSDGRPRRLDQIRVGDLIYGTVRRGAYRRYVTTRVLAHWSTLKAAYRVTLADGTTLTASADHRFLTERGWKFVAPDPAGGQRPTLTPNNKLMGVGTGGAVRPPLEQTAASIERTVGALRELEFDCVTEDRGAANGIRTVRVRGGLRKHLEFFLAVDPVITRKRVFAGQAVKSNVDLRVVSVQPLGEVIPMYDITTGTGDFLANGVISHNCFARPTHRYLDLNAREDFEREIVVKVNLPERLRAELKRPSWKGDVIALGTNTDPYQWVEGRYELTRGIWEVLLEARNPCSVLTKSPLLLRDLDLFERLVRVTDFTASLSIPTLDESAWRATEPRTPHPRKRIEAVAELNRAGIPTGVLVAPLMPGINDSPAQVEEILQLCADAGARSVSGLGLHLKGEVREIFLDWLRSYRPDLLDHYEGLYARGAFLPRAERDRLRALLGSARRKAGVRNGWRRSRPARGPRRPAEKDDPPAGSQRSLF